MIQGRCPICSRTYEIAALNDVPPFPFCSKRCRLIDLGRWIDAQYALPGKPASQPPNTDQGEDSDDDLD
jgi:endogenous inhibitor of DNA gyrase (YacG/DUF329 family)